MLRKRSVLLSLLALALGIGGLSLEMLLFGAADGLVPRRHPAGIGLTVLSVLTVILFLVLSHKPEPAPKEGGELLSRILRTAAAIPGCYCIGKLGNNVYQIMEGILPLVLLGLGILGAVALVVFGVLPEKHRQTRSLSIGVACLFFCVQLLCRFRISGSDPQIHDYIVTVLAGACLMAFSYHAAANALGRSDGKAFEFWRLVGIYFCTAAVCTGGDAYAAACLWLILSTPVGFEAQ